MEHRISLFALYSKNGANEENLSNSGLTTSGGNDDDVLITIFLSYLSDFIPSFIISDGHLVV